jgi:hypothetical protein
MVLFRQVLQTGTFGEQLGSIRAWGRFRLSWHTARLSARQSSIAVQRPPSRAVIPCLNSSIDVDDDNPFVPALYFSPS